MDTLCGTDLWKIFSGGTSQSFSQFIIDPKKSLSCDFSQIWTDDFEKNPFICIPYLGQKRPFFGPEGLFLTQNLKNIVKQVVIIQNNAFQGLKWSPSNNVIFGVCRPPKPPQGPPQTPPMVQGGQKWPKCTCTSPMLIINDKKRLSRGWIFWPIFSLEMPQGEICLATIQAWLIWNISPNHHKCVYWS